MQKLQEHRISLRCDTPQKKHQHFNSQKLKTWKFEVHFVGIAAGCILNALNCLQAESQVQTMLRVRDRSNSLIPFRLWLLLTLLGSPPRFVWLNCAGHECKSHEKSWQHSLLFQQNCKALSSSLESVAPLSLADVRKHCQNLLVQIYRNNILFKEKYWCVGGMWFRLWRKEETTACCFILRKHRVSTKLSEPRLLGSVRL